MGTRPNNMASRTVATQAASSAKVENTPDPAPSPSGATSASRAQINARDSMLFVVRARDECVELLIRLRVRLPLAAR